MLTKTVVSFLAVMAIVKTAYCIQCYTCFSLDNPDCQNPEKYKMGRVNCDTDQLRLTQEYATRMNKDYKKIFEVHIHEHAVPLNCLKHVIKVGSTEVVLRGCQLPKDNTLDVCTKVLELEPQNFALQHCSLCPTDGCNGSTRLHHAASVHLLLLLTFVAIVAPTAFRRRY